MLKSFSFLKLAECNTFSNQHYTTIVDIVHCYCYNKLDNLFVIIRCRFEKALTMPRIYKKQNISLKSPLYPAISRKKKCLKIQKIFSSPKRSGSTSFLETRDHFAERSDFSISLQTVDEM